jgi:uncharacterized membrane protein (UPF0127 family)
MCKTISKFVLPTVLLSFLAGCGKDDSSSNSALVPIKNSSSGNTSGGDTATNSQVAPIDNASGSNTSSTGTDPSKTYGVKNPDRVFQTESLEKTTIKTPGGDLTLWIMDTEDKRREGMMFLHDNEVKDNEGMLFLFPDVQKLSGNYSFWMHNTLIPLDIDYISKEKKLLNVGVGKKQSDTPVKPAGDYFYVIEVKQGLSPKFGLTPGAKIDISDALKGKP